MRSVLGWRLLSVVATALAVWAPGAAVAEDAVSRRDGVAEVTPPS